jgi:hypothetical protein
MRCAACGYNYSGGVGTRCPHCGWMPREIGVTPMEYVVHTATGTHHVRKPWQRYPWSVRLLYLLGALAWALPVWMAQYFRVNPLPGGRGGWRMLGMVLTVLLAALLHTMLWAFAFFYSRLLTSDQIADEAEGA